MWRAGLALVGAVFVASCGGGDIHFTTTKLATSSAPYPLAAADLDLDGKPDLIAGIDGPLAPAVGSVSAFLDLTAARSAGVRFSMDAELSVGQLPVAIAVGDLNGDGMPDLAVADGGGQSNAVSVLLGATPAGASTPGFLPAVEFPVGANPEAVVIADLDGDGRLDLAVTGHNARIVSILRNTTPAGAQLPSFAPRLDLPGGGSAMAAADVNGDGRIDLVLADSGVVAVLINTTAASGAPTFTVMSLPGAVDTNGSAIAVGDLNRDGKPDLVTINNDNSVLVFINISDLVTGTLNFEVHSIPLHQVNPAYIALGDIDGDGETDVAVSNEASTGVLGSVSLLRNGTPHAATTPNFSLQNIAVPHPRGIVIADFNQDGRGDLAVADASSIYDGSTTDSIFVLVAD